MKKGRLLLILGLALLVIIAGYFMMRSMHLNENDQSDSDDTSAETELIYETDASLIERIDVVGEEIYTLEKGNGDVWSCAEYPDFTLDPGVVDGAIDLLSTINSTTTMPDDTLPSDYGFDDPSLTLTVFSSDGNEHRIILGMKNPVTQDYYFMQDDEKTIYMVSTKYYDLFALGMTAFAENETLPDLTGSNVTDLLIQVRNEEDKHFIYFPDGTDEVYNYSEFWFYDSPVYGLMSLETKSFGDYVNGMTSTVMERPIALANEQTFSEYGFDDPLAVITYKYEAYEQNGSSGTVKIYVSDALDDENMRYAMLEGGEYIYKMGKSNFTKMYEVTLSEYLTPVALPIDLATIDTVDFITKDGKTRTVKYEAVDPGVEGAIINTFNYYVDGEQLNEDDAYAYRVFFNMLRAEYADSIRFDLDEFDYEQTPDVTVIVHRNTEKYDTLVLRLYYYDSSFYVADFNGLHIQLFNKNFINSFISQIPQVFHEN